MNALKAAEKARAKGGLALFLCPSRPGELRLTPATCASSHKASKTALEEAKVRLWYCRDCEVGAANMAALGGTVTKKKARTASRIRGGENAHKALPETLVATLGFVRARGRCTAPDAAKHFGRHRDTIADRLQALERLGLVRRFMGSRKALMWEAV